MFKTLTRWLSKSQPRTRSRSANRKCRLGLEALEAREVPASFTLSGSNLYETNGTLRTLIDTNVQQYTVVGNKIYDLHTDNSLVGMNTNGSGKTTLDYGVTKYAVPTAGAYAGQVLELRANGLLNERGPTGWSQVETNVVRFAVPTAGAYAGQVLALRADGSLNLETPGASTLVDTNVVSVGVNGLGYALELRANGLLNERGPTGWSQVETNVVRFAVPTAGAYAGQVLALRADGSLNLETPGASTLVDTNVVSVGVNGLGYALELRANGLLNERGPTGWSQVETNVVRFAVPTAGAYAGQVLALRADGSLNLETPGASTLVDTNVVSVGVNGLGYALELRANGLLNERGPTGWSQVETNVVRFAVPTAGAYAGQVLALRADGSLNLETPGASTLVWGTTKDFAVTPNGTLYWLGTGGTFWRINPDDSRDWLSTNNGVTSLAISTMDGSVYALTTGGNLDRYVPGGSVNQIAGNVTSFAVNPSGAVYAVQNPATLEAETGQSDTMNLDVPGSSVQFTYTLASGSVPGLSLSSAGVLSGTPTVPGTYTFTVQATSTSLPGLIVTQVCTEIVTAISTTSPNWSGYVASPGSGVSAVGGTWVQPAVNGSGVCSIWVGIDGWGNHTVEQLGTAWSPTAGYQAWIEFFGNGTLNVQGQWVNEGNDFNQTNIPVAIHPHDTISTEVSLVPGTSNEFLFHMTDKPASGGPIETYSQVQTMNIVTPQRSTAEWVVEAYSLMVNGKPVEQPLADFGQVNFSGAWATANGITGGVNSQKNLLALNMSSSEGQDLTSNPPSLKNTLGYNEPASGVSSSSFSVTWLTGANGVNSAATNASTMTGGITNSAATISDPITPTVPANSAGNAADERRPLHLEYLDVSDPSAQQSSPGLVMAFPMASSPTDRFDPVDDLAIGGAFVG